MRRPFLRCLSLTLRHLGFSCFPTTFHLLESSLSVYPKKTLLPLRSLLTTPRKVVSSFLQVP